MEETLEENLGSAQLQHPWAECWEAVSTHCKYLGMILHLLVSTVTTKINVITQQVHDLNSQVVTADEVKNNRSEDIKDFLRIWMILDLSL